MRSWIINEADSYLIGRHIKSRVGSTIIIINNQP
jgi:hypothetical protein